MTRHRPAAILLAFLVLFGFLPTSIRSDGSRHEARIVILHTNDLHGAVYPQEARGPDAQVVSRRGGFPSVLAYVRQVRAEARRAGDVVFLVDAGDFFQGTPEGDLPEGRLMVHLMNLAAYDLAAPGNHEFDQGPAVAEALARRARFPFLCANMYREDPLSRPEWVRPYLLVEAHGLRLAFVGLITSEMPLVTTAKARRGLVFADEIDTLLQVLPMLDAEEEPDVKVLVTHCGVEKDKEIARSIPEIDLVIGGHSHTLLERGWQAPGTGTLVVQAGSSARWIGRVDLTVDLETRVVVSKQARVIPLDVAEVGEDADAKALVAGFAPDIDREMNLGVGTAAGPIGRGGGVGSSPLGNLLTDVMRATTGARIAFHNRAGIRADLPTGAVRLRDMYQVSPFGNTLVTMELTGVDVLALLERGLSGDTRWLLEVSGLVVRFDPEAPPGKRVHEVRIETTDGGSVPLDPEARYSAVTNSFLARGGDGHVPFTRGTDVHDTGILLLDAQVRYFRERSPVTAPEDARIARR